jgi:phage gp29-like protein
MLSAILNRDLVRPWVDLEFGPRAGYPRIVIARAEAEDLGLMATALAAMVDRGLEVEQSAIRDRFGLSEPGPGAAILRPATAVSGPASGRDMPFGGPGFDRPPPSRPAAPSLNANSAVIKGGAGAPGMVTALEAEGRPAATPARLAPDAILADRLEAEARPQMAAVMASVEAMLAAAGSLEEFREMLLAGLPGLDLRGLAGVMEEAGLAAQLAGRVAAEEEAGGGGGDA